jgi:hypothetical protein
MNLNALVEEKNFFLIIFNKKKVAKLKHINFPLQIWTK